MDSEAFFKALQNQFNMQLPFVAYRMPQSKVVKALLQPIDTVFYVNDFLESGFVFAPFDSSKKTVLMPILECEELILNSTEPIDEKSFNIESCRHQFSNSACNSINENITKEAHVKLVKRGVKAIKASEFDKVVLSRFQSIQVLNSNPIRSFLQLLQNYSTAFVYCWFHPKIGLWLGATPETLLTVKDNKFETMALAGTQEYKGALKVEWSVKEKEEQRIVTDFIVDSLQKSLDSNNIKVSNVKTVKAGNLLHLQTKVKGVLNFSTFNLKNVLNALHPTPAVCGFPKESAKHFILQNESYDRQFYTGFLGELNIKNTSNLFVNLRCMQWLQDKALIYTGGGITKDSHPEAEWQETVNKSQTIISVLS